MHLELAKSKNAMYIGKDIVKTVKHTSPPGQLFGPDDTTDELAET